MNPKLYYCYSNPLKQFLIQNGERFITKSIHERTNKKYWVFVSSDKLNSLLNDWRLRKNS